MLFIVALFLIKKTTFFQNKETYQSANQENGLAYENVTLQDLVNTDTDGDGVLDWQESLYGLDPTKKETTPGTPDGQAMSKLSAQSESALGGKEEKQDTPENLTETEKFSRELFATVATASQGGAMDQETIDQLGASLSDKIQNAQPRKVFSIFDIKTINSDSDSAQDFRNYNNALTSVATKYPTVSYTVLDVLEKFMADENNVDVSMLAKLDPIIEQMNKVKEGMKEMSVPHSIVTLHLNVLNSLERLSENVSDIKLFESDIILALGGISNYQTNATALEGDLNNLENAINQKLSN